MNDLIIQHLDIWTSAIASKATAGRGLSTPSPKGEGRGEGNPTSTRNAKVTAYGIKKLRELILELAVRGKLVPQDPNDEPVSILLSKVSKEQKSANPKRKAKNGSELTQNSDYKKPFALPIGWVWVSLESIGNIFNGNSISSSIKQSKYTNLVSGLPFIATKDVGYGWDELDYGNGVLIPLNETGFRVAHKSAVLICAEGGSAGKKCGITKQDICFGNKLFAIELYGEIEPNYILANYLTPTFFQQFTGKMTGIIGGISSASFSQLMIPLPPLAEQRRIVAKVDELMDLCDQLEQQQTDNLGGQQTLVQTLLDTLTQAADTAEFEQAWSRIADHFDTLFTTEPSIDQIKQTLLQLAVMGKLVPQNPDDEPVSETIKRIKANKAHLIACGKAKFEKPLDPTTQETVPFSVPRGWEWQKIDSLVFSVRNDIRTGPFGSSLHKDDHRSEGVPVWGIESINKNGSFSGRNKIYLDLKKAQELSSFAVKGGDIIISRSGTVGELCRLPDNIPQGLISTNLMKISLDNQIILPDYFCLLFKGAQSIDSQLAELCFGSTRLFLTQSILTKLLFPIPPLAEQHRIVAKVDELMALCDALKARIAAAQTTQLQLADAIVEQAVA